MKLALSLSILEACVIAANAVNVVNRRPVDNVQSNLKSHVAGFSSSGTSEGAFRRKMEETTYTYLLYGGIAVLVAAAVGGTAFFISRKKGAAQENEEEVPSVDGAAPEAQAVAEPASKAEVNIEKFMKLVVKRTAQQVGPKLAKANNVRNVLESRIFGFKNKAATFIMDELFGAVAQILREVEAEEAMLLLDPTAAASANLPPVSILLAGFMSPIVLIASLIIHLLQIFLVLVPVLGMCVWALYIDWNTLSTCAVPTISYWIYIQAFLCVVLLLSHLTTTVNLKVGIDSILAKLDSMKDRVREALSDGELSMGEMRELFIVSAILLETCLVVEDGLRRSFSRTVIGYGTVLWIAVTMWNFVIVLGWTFIPGMVAFHPSAAKVAGDDFCGAWATVFTARLSCVLSLLFLMTNLISLLQWVSDKLVTSEAYSAGMIGWARQFDKNAGGFPVMETLVKAFLLRGNGDSIKDQIAQSYDRKHALQKQQSDLQSKIAVLQGRIQVHKDDAVALKKAQGIEEDDLSAFESELHASGAAAAEEAMAKAKRLEEQTKEELQAMVQKFMDAANQLRQSEVVQGALTQAHQLQDGGVQGLTDAASSGMASAQAAASSGMASAQEAASSGMASGVASAQKAAASVQEAAGPGLASAQQAASRTVEQAKAQAKAVAGK